MLASSQVILLNGVLPEILLNNNSVVLILFFIVLFAVVPFSRFFVPC